MPRSPRLPTSVREPAEWPMYALRAVGDRVRSGPSQKHLGGLVGSRRRWLRSASSTWGKAMPSSPRLASGADSSPIPRHCLRDGPLATGEKPHVLVADAELET